jgi:hypothetical protein
MLPEDHCQCEEHGVQPIAFVCRHIIQVPRGQTAGFVSSLPDDDHDLRDAWCLECDAYLQSHGGEWVDDSVEVPGGIALICAGCYREREADAVRLEKRVTYPD